MAAIDENVRIISLNIGRESYGIDINNIVSILKYSKITPVPLVDDMFLGVINVRGIVIPVISLRRVLDFEDIAIDDDTRIFIIHDEDNVSIALLVDKVNDVIDVIPEDYTEDITENVPNRIYLKGVLKKDDKLISILNLETLFDSLKNNVGAKLE